MKDSHTSCEQERLPTGLICYGTKAGSQTSLLDRWRSTQPEKKNAIVVSLDSSQTANLMTALKNLVRAALIQLDGIDGYQMFLNERKRSIHTNYDLELLQNFVTSRKVQKCVVYLTDVEAFDIVVLTDLVSILSAWRDRIPFVLLLGISTTVDLFEARLPKSTIRLLNCRHFDASIRVNPCLEIYQKLHSPSHGSVISFGPAVSSVLLEISREQDASAASFSRAIKYATMSHFFANALSILLELDTDDMYADRELCEAIRSTGSFRAYAEEKFNEGEARAVRDLLDNDKALLGAAREAIWKGQEAIARHHAAVELLEELSNLLESPEVSSDFFSIHAQASSGRSFLDSALFTDLITSITNLPSDDMREILDVIQKNNMSLQHDINTLTRKLDCIAPTSTKVPLRSAYDPNHATTSTTITNNKVSLSKHGPKLSAKETEYTRLVDQIRDTLTSYFENNICNPTNLFMREAFVYDLKSPLATVFTPRPRHATERALSTPYDYLGRDCCEGQATGQISATQPPTSILWQLWCEAGGIVNVMDLWNAFSAVLVRQKGDDEKEEEDDDDSKVSGVAQVAGRMDERMAFALFYRGVAELRMMGFLKGTKRKADCLAKTAWKQL